MLRITGGRRLESGPRCTLDRSAVSGVGNMRWLKILDSTWPGEHEAHGEPPAMIAGPSEEDRAVRLQRVEQGARGRVKLLLDRGHECVNLCGWTSVLWIRGQAWRNSAMSR